MSKPGGTSRGDLDLRPGRHKETGEAADGLIRRPPTGQPSRETTMNDVQRCILWLDLDGTCGDFYARVREIAAIWTGNEIESHPEGGSKREPTKPAPSSRPGP